jgi:two-component system, NarL family, response regulator NreC
MLESQPDFKVIGEADNGIEALRLVEQIMPDVFVSDVVMPGMTGIEVQRMIQRLNPRPRTIFLSLHDNQVYVGSAKRNGALGYVLKHSVADHLVPAVRAALKGESYTFPELSAPALVPIQNFAKSGTRHAVSEISDRERNILAMMADGFENPQISSRFAIEQADMQKTVATLMEKFGAVTRKDLVRMAQGRSY